MRSIKYRQSFDQCNHTNGKSESNIIKWCNKFNQLWERSDRLFGLLRSSNDFYRQPIKLRLPLLFYLGHLPCFAWIQFRHLKNVNKVIDVLYDKLFERGVDPNVQTGVVNHEHSSRFSVNDDIEKEYWLSFSVQSVVEYKLKVRSEILNVFMNGNLNFDDIETLNILNVAAEHEMMHQETLMYLFAQLPIEALRVDVMNETDLRLRHVTPPLSENIWILLPGGQTSLGKPYNEETATYSFGWDNEFPCEPTYVSSFELQSHPVRIGDYLQFVLDGGYIMKEWWDNDVFEWIIESKICHPPSWSYDGSYSVNFILQRDVPIESVLDHPVLVSQVEAKAYCRWLSHKTGYTIDLPTEAEWVYAMWDWSKCASMTRDSSYYNVNFRHLHTIPVDSSTNKNLQWQGSAFEWTSSVFRPFTGYRGSLPSYPGYSSDFFDDCHFVLLGGSFATDSTLIRRTFRNWFQDTYRYVFATFRCVKRNGHTDHPLTLDDRKVILTTLNNSNHRSIPSQYFYDAHGSAIYEQITQLDEYYLFSQELKLLQQRAVDMRKTILQHSNLQNGSSNVHIIELGCGDGSKVETWLSPWVNSNDHLSVVYHPVDISQHAIDSLVQRLKQTMGETIIEKHVKPVCSTFEQMYTKLDPKLMEIQVVMLLGSTIGNFSSFDSNNVKYGNDSPVIKFFRLIRSNLKVRDWFLCGFDLCKDTKTMIEAYSDSKGITAAFNYNLLLRLNRELNFNFKITNYQHYAMFNPLLRRMESWLISTKQQTVNDENGFTMQLEPYEAIQTEVSTKYTEEDIQLLMKKTSFKIIEFYRTNDHHLPYALCMAQAI
jgi:dimethylhistidine N-methyltransferase